MNSLLSRTVASTLGRRQMSSTAKVWVDSKFVSVVILAWSDGQAELKCHELPDIYSLGNVTRVLCHGMGDIMIEVLEVYYITPEDVHWGSSWWIPSKPTSRQQVKFVNCTLQKQPERLISHQRTNTDLYSRCRKHTRHLSRIYRKAGYIPL